MYKYLLLIIIPFIVNVVLYVLPMREKEKYGIVMLPRSIFFYFPTIVSTVALFFLVLNITSFVKDHDNDSKKGICILSIVVFLSTILLVYFYVERIKFDSEKFKYHNKWYYFSDIETSKIENDKYVLTLKTRKKVKIDTSCVGSFEFYNTYCMLDGYHNDTGYASPSRDEKQ